MEKYISELIQENNRVIIPNFGAFIISKENGFSILFNNFLSFNDGLLVNYVAEKKGIDTIVATDQVFEFVDELKKQLDEKGIYSIEKLGVFKKDENGILRFQQAEDFGQDFISENQSAKEEVNDIKNKQEEKPEETQKETFLLDIDNSSEITEALDDEKIEDSSTDNKVTSDSEPILTIDSETEEKEEKEDHKSTITTPPVIQKEKVAPVTQNKEDKATKTNKYVQKTIEEKKRKDIITFIVIAIFIVLCIAAYFIFFNKSDKKVIKPIPVKVEKPVKKKPVVIDTVPKTISKPEPPKETVKPIVTESKDFFIIVGGFKNEANAVKMLNKLKEQGFGNAQIIPKGNMFLVSADSSPSYKVIEARQQEILENNRIESWLYKIR